MNQRQERQEAISKAHHVMFFGLRFLKGTSKRESEINAEVLMLFTGLGIPPGEVLRAIRETARRERELKEQKARKRSA